MKLKLVIFFISLGCISLVIPSAFADNGKHYKHHHNVVEQRTAIPESAYVDSPVLAHDCPFSCRTSGINKSYCKDWREGSLCYVQITRRSAVPYHIIEQPTAQRSYYLVEPRQRQYPERSLGEIVENAVTRAVDNVTH